MLTPPTVPAMTSVSSSPLRSLTEEAGGTLAGPWDQAYWFTIPIDIKSKSNHRHDARGRDAWEKLSKFEQDVNFLASKYLPTPWPLAAELPTPKRPIVVGYLFAFTLLDTLNLSKSVGDALQHVVVANDCSIRAFTQASSRTGKKTGGLLALAQLPADATFAAQSAATAELHRQAATLLDPLNP